MRTVYETDDGSKFDTEEEALTYENGCKLYRTFLKLGPISYGVLADAGDLYNLDKYLGGMEYEDYVRAGAKPFPKLVKIYDRKIGPLPRAELESLKIKLDEFILSLKEEVP